MMVTAVAKTLTSRSSPLLNHQSIRWRLKRYGDRPVGQRLRILGREYRTDEWTNVPDKVIQLVEQPAERLHQTPGNPIYLIAESLRRHFSRFTCFHFRDPVVTLWQNFDSILVPEGHISRSRTDTFYVNAEWVLRSHTSAHQSDCFRRLAAETDPQKQQRKFMIIGDVYRRDEVNRTHHAAFHQAEIVELFTAVDLCSDGFGLFDETNRTRNDECQERHRLPLVQMVERQLKSQVESYIHRMFADGPIETRWVPAYFPFTHPSWELEIRTADGEWLEMMGCGIIEQQILDRDGHPDRMGWALGFGLERLAMLYYGIPDIRLFWSRDTGFLVQFAKLEPFQRYQYRPISSYPQKIFDVSFWLPSASTVEQTWSSNDVHALILEIGGDLVEQAHLVDEWRRPSDGRISNLYRIVYRSHERAITTDQANEIHRRIERALVNELNVEIR